MYSPIADNYDAMAVCDDGSCCYSTSSVLQIFTNVSTVIHNAVVVKKCYGYTILASGGSQAGDVADSTYYNYCLPISDSCAAYELVLWNLF